MSPRQTGGGAGGGPGRQQAPHTAGEIASWTAIPRAGPGLGVQVDQPLGKRQRAGQGVLRDARGVGAEGCHGHHLSEIQGRQVQVVQAHSSAGHDLEVGCLLAEGG